MKPNRAHNRTVIGPLEWLRPYVRTLRYSLRVARHILGSYERTCTVCGHKGKFFAYGSPYSLGINLDALCPSCLSLERHRLLVLCDREQDLFSGKSVLHFSPELGLQRYIRSRAPSRYVTCQYGGQGADLDLDIHRIELPADSFQAVVCLHVLEHVEDGAAIAELFRILEPGGLLVAMTPVIEGWDHTFEDDSRTKTARDRLLYFNQEDHVRFFGRDIRTRLSSAGFEVDEYTAVEPAVAEYGLLRGEKVFLCRKPIRPHNTSAMTKP